jgi:hypothetical protein
MVFDKYYDMWDKYGVKLTSRVEITNEILDQVTGKPDVCDLIWAINAANQSNQSLEILSNTVMDQIQKSLPLLLNHKGRFSEYHSGDEVVARAKRHFTSDVVGGFKKRQTKIRNMLEGYINTNSSERNNTRSVKDSLAQGEIPTRDEIQAIYMKNAIHGESIATDRLKKLIEDCFQKQGRQLHSDWWEETKKILRNGSEKQRPSDKIMQGKTILRKKE